MGEELGELGRRPRQGERGPFPRTVWLPEGHRQFSAMHVAASRGGGVCGLVQSCGQCRGGPRSAGTCSDGGPGLVTPLLDIWEPRLHSLYSQKHQSLLVPGLGLCGHSTARTIEYSES